MLPGGVGGGGGGAAAPTTLDSAIADVDPRPFLTVIVNRRANPASAACTVYFPVPETAAQVAPVASQRAQLADTLSGEDPVHDPWPRTSTSPTWGAAVSGTVSYPVLVAFSIWGADVAAGSELGCGSLNPSAASVPIASTRPYLTEKPTGTALDSIACSTCEPLADGLAENAKPAIADTTGAASEVPPTGPYPGAPFSDGQAVRLLSGAATVTHDP